MWTWRELTDGCGGAVAGAEQREREPEQWEMRSGAILEAQESCPGVVGVGRIVVGSFE
jgi:hypothetical protein